MGSIPGAQKNKEAETQNEGPIASRLRSKTKIGDAQTSSIEHTPGTHVKKSSDKPSQNSRNQKDNKSRNYAEKKGELLHTPSTNRALHPSSTDNNHPNKIIIKDSTRDDAKRRRQDSKKQNANSSSDRANQNSSKNNNQRPKKMENNSAAKKSNNLPMPSSSKSNNGQKNQKKNKPAMNNSTKGRPVYYIRWKGFETATGWNCAFCEKDLAYSPDTEEYKEDYSCSDDEEEYKLEHLLTSRMGLELEQHSSLLPEVSVLPCTHAFHSMCLHDAEMDLIDSPCPICISLL